MKALYEAVEKEGFYTLGLGDWLMELKNSEGFKPIYY
jgi:hypothetical protein